MCDRACEFTAEVNEGRGQFQMSCFSVAAGEFAGCFAEIFAFSEPGTPALLLRVFRKSDIELMTILQK